MHLPVVLCHCLFQFPSHFYFPYTTPQERMALKESVCRSMPPEETARVFDEMLKGSEEGVSYCLRIKIDMKSENGALRDPVVFRCNDHKHWRTGTKYKVGRHDGMCMWGMDRDLHTHTHTPCCGHCWCDSWYSYLCRCCVPMPVLCTYAGAVLVMVMVSMCMYTSAADVPSLLIVQHVVFHKSVFLVKAEAD